MSKKQSYRNSSISRLTRSMGRFMVFAYNYLTHNQTHGEGSAGGHLNTSYVSGGGSGGNTNKMVSKDKVFIIKKKRRSQKRKSQRINRRNK